LRVADVTGEVDTHLFGKEAELFLGVTAARFAANKAARQRVKLKLLSLCQSQFLASAPASMPAPESESVSVPVPVRAMTTRRVTRGSRAQQQQQQQREISAVPASVPLLTLNLFSYLPAMHTGEAAVRLAVVGTTLDQL
jgi:hypothetical protein